MSYLSSEEFDDLKEKIKELKDKKNEDSYSLELFTLVSSFYLLTKDPLIKDTIIDEILNLCDINEGKLHSILIYILNKNIILESQSMNFNKWIIIGKNVKRKECLLNFKKDNYNLILKKEYPSINYLDLFS